MDDRSDATLAARFETQRGRLQAVAYRILGSRAEAEDAVQETWLRLHRTDVGGVDNLDGWLTTVTSRVCLDVLRARRTRPEAPLETEPALPAAFDPGPEASAEAADSVAAALLVVLDTLGPDERLSFVLHDLFGVPFGEIAPILDRTPASARQLASRARRRVQGGSAAYPPDEARRRRVVEAFLAASREGRFADLLTLLHPDAVLRADRTAVAMGAEREVSGAVAVATALDGKARAAQAALVDGLPGAVWQLHRAPRIAFCFDVADGRVRGVQLVGDPERLARATVDRVDGETVIWWSADDPGFDGVF